ncbi:hypothetical protein [Curtobacterium sp. MCBD17_040]|uniref:hypothetical protein n=1 Tax=Curtobacterium sp. MCBD17_040 TaxID=2175674 RepID=UPI000DA76F80|nr:hypothetical protein [Curtobacterium sp. MCBD17_040]WIB65552.1 hypothetical protein DEI94_19450 [Curtobacterium sp. MCBD17_040]
MAKKKNDPLSNWLDEAEDVPRARVTPTRKLERRQRFFRIWVFSSVFLLPLALLMAWSSAVNNHGSGASHTSAAAVVDVKGRTAATVAVQQWLASSPSPVAGKGQILSYDGQSIVKKPANPKDSNGKVTVVSAAYTTEMQHFTVQDGLGQTYAVDVEVAVNKTYGAAVLAGPSLLPEPAADTTQITSETSNASGTWPGLYDSSASSAVSQTVKLWADAFAKGSSDDLRLAVQDKVSKHTYQTLNNVSSVTATIDAAAYDFGSPTANIAGNGKRSSKQLVRVTLYLQWKGNPAPAPGQEQDTLPSVTYDLLVQQANTAAPVVTAWGSPGSGPTLQPYQNALVGISGQPSNGSTPAPAAAADSATTGG